jgi:hypothetical protein
MPNYYIDGDGFLIETCHQFAVYDFRKKALQPNPIVQHLNYFAIRTNEENKCFFKIVQK